ncbi:Alpha crystallin/Hsp20 domain [Dillenia turbinata]|uniref:Alpha crystallin/Hsp20 domain n=1 Tax=Dillenia turbinata TaxID=194707 RepID=A0AAN8ZD08_9MAGN
MATRPRTSEGPTPRPPAGVRPVYELFKPTFEWMQDEEGSYVLLVYLPGFVKEQIKVIAESTGILKIQGERLVVGNKWSRFQEDYLIPENCNMNAIRARFEGGILYVKMPKKASTRADPRYEPKPTKEATVSPKDTSETKPQKPRDETPPKPSPSLGGEKRKEVKSVEAPSTQKAPSEAIPQNGQESLPLKDTTSTGLKKESDWKAVGSSTAQELKSEAKSQEIKDERPSQAEQRIEDKTFEFASKKKFVQRIEEKEKTRDTKDKASESGKTKTGAPNAFGKQKDQEGIYKFKDKKDDSANVERMMKELEDPKQKAEDFYEDAKARESATKSRPGYSTERYKKAMEDPTKELKGEEKELLVNVGVAALVIVALGAYISYTIGSSGSS